MQWIEWWVRRHKCILISCEFLTYNLNILFGHTAYRLLFFNVHVQINENATYAPCKLKYLV